MRAERYDTNSIVMAMQNYAKNARLPARVIVGSALILMLAGCSGSTEDKIGRLMVAPEKFYLYTCAQLEAQANSTIARRKQLQQLMAKAETTPDGRIVSFLTYQSPYTEAGADLNELRRASAARDCKPSAVLAKPVRKPGN